MSSRARSSDRPHAAPRVLYLLTSDISTIFVRGQLDAVHDAGFDVHLATNFRDGERPAIDDAATTWHLPLERDPAPLHDLRALVATVRLMRRVRPDIVHAGTPKAGLVGSLAAWFTRTPVRCYALHGLRYETATGRFRRVLLALERLAGRCATVVIADSPSLRSVALADHLAADDKIIVLGRGSSNGVDTQRFTRRSEPMAARRRLGIDRFAIVIGFVGRITRDKGIDDLVDVFVDRFADRPDIGLLLVGSSEDSDPLAPSTRDHLATHPGIVHIPWLDDTTDAYEAMDVVAFASYREGLPNVPLEAQSMQVPVVGYAATGTVDSVAHPSLLVPVGDTAALGSILERVVADADERHELGRTARTWVASNFDRRVVWRQKVEFFTASTPDR